MSQAFSWWTSSRRLWYLERHYHFESMHAFFARDEAAEWEALRNMAACRDELNRRGVTHL